MDLVRGICFFCSNSKVVSNTRNVHNTIITLFTGTGINEEGLLNLRPPRVCHLCYHSFVLMKRTHDDILHSSSAEKVHENCHLCGNSEDVIKVSRWSHFDKIGKDYRGLIGNAISNACSDCLYYLETKNSVKDKLIAAHPKLNKVSDFVSNITSHSTPLRRTRTKAERKVPLEFIDLTDMDADIKKFKTLRRDRELKKSKLIAKDPKLMDQILIIKLQSLNKSLEKENDIVKVKKTGPQKKVRFKDINELEEDISSTPKKIKYKETRYHDNFISSSNNDENYEAKEDELVEYEIKTSTPRKCKYRKYSDDSSSDSSDGRKKSFFKIKLTKKKTSNEKPLKSALVKSPKSTVILKTNRKLSLGVRPSPKSTKKQRPVARSRRNPVTTSNDKVLKPDFRDNLIINVERMKIPESYNVDNIEVEIESEDLVESEDTLDPLRIDTLGNGDSQMDVDVIELNNVEDKNNKEVSQDDISSSKKIPDTNGHTEELSEENQESSQDTVSEVSSDKKEIISISSDDGIKESKETKKRDDVGETLNEIKLFLQQSEIEKKPEKLKETQEVKHKELDKTDDSQESKEEETIMTNDDVLENSKNKTDEEIVKDTDTSQFDENTESEAKDTSTEQNGNTLEEDLGEAKEKSRNESQKEVEKVINNKEDEETENSQEETENSQDETENSQEETENSQEETENSQEEKTENGQGETENSRKEETENSQEREAENSQDTENSKEEETENSQEDTENSKEEETENSQEDTENSKEGEETENSQEESQEENDEVDTHLSIDDVTAVLGSFETVSELDKTEDSEETEENLEMKKRKRDDDSLFDFIEPDKKKKKVTFSGDLSSD